jgi:hypothetical protein
MAIDPRGRRIDAVNRKHLLKFFSQSETSSMDEIKLGEAAAKAMRAQDLLDNELLSEAFKGLEDSYTAAWRASGIEDVAGREKLFLAINIVGKVRDHLRSIVANGKLAQVELTELARTAERRKRFGIV